MHKKNNRYYDKEELKRVIPGSAMGLLIKIGISAEVLDEKNHPCPKCGGKDRFRAFDIDKGVLYCNQCFCEKNGDIFAAIQWWLGCSFNEAIEIVGDYLNAPHSQPPKRQESKQAKAALPFSEQIEFLEPDQEKLSLWANYKPPVTGEAALAAGARLCRWHNNFPFDKRFECVAFPAYKNSEEPTGWILYRLNGDDFPAKPDGRRQRKVQVLKGSKDGLVFVGERLAIEAAHTILKVEGVPDALAISPYLPEGVGVVTNINGATSYKKCPIELFKGKQVILIGDSDKPGMEGVEKFARKIAPYSTETIILKLSDEITESGGQDLRDVMNENKLAGTDYQATIDKLLLQVDRTSPFKVSEDEPQQDEKTEEYKPFPIECLPPVIRDYVKAGAKSLRCDYAYITLPLLVVTASMIGASRVLKPSNDWAVPSTLWAVVIAYSGSMKSPAMKLATDPIYKLQSKVHARNIEVIEAYETRKAIYEARMKDYIKELAKADGQPPGEPEKPDEPRIVDKIAGDVTFERLAYMIKHNPKGILLSKDELSGLIGSLNKYSGSKGSDEAVLLEGYNLGTIQVHRKHDPQDLFIPKASICINGNTQPEIYKRIMNGSYRESGFMARFLKAYPPRTVKEYPGDGIPDDIKAALMTMIESLDQLQPMEPEEGVYEPESIFLTKEAKAAYKQFHRWHNIETATMTGDLPAEWSKLEEIPLRLSLIIHCVECVTTGQATERVSAETMHNAIRITEWFKKESLRVYRLFEHDDSGKSAQQQEAQKIIKFIRNNDGSVRDIQRHVPFKTADETEKALGNLVKNGVAEWVEIPTQKKGQPSRGIRLRHLTSAAETSGLEVDVLDDGESDAIQTEPAPKKTPE